MPDIEMCISVRCPVSVFCRRHRDSGTVPGVMQAYGYHDPDESGRCDEGRGRVEGDSEEGSEEASGGESDHDWREKDRSRQNRSLKNGVRE